MRLRSLVEHSSNWTFCIRYFSGLDLWRYSRKPKPRGDQREATKQMKETRA